MKSEDIRAFFNEPAPKKTLVLTSLKQHDNKSEIIKDIDDFFDDEDKYLCLDSHIYVGRKPKGPRYNQKNEIVQYSYVGDPNIIKRSNMIKKPQNIISKKMSASGNLSHRTYESQAQSLKRKGADYDVLDGKMLHNLYLDMRNQTEKNKIKTNEEILNQLPILIQDRLKNQQKNLKDYVDSEKRYHTMENYIMKKTHKTREQLLMTNIDSFQFKNAILRTISDKIPNELQLGDNSWYYNLRRPKNFVGSRDCYINMRTNDNPFWGRFFEKSPKTVLKCRKPLINKKYLKTFDKNPYLSLIPYGENTVKEMGEMAHLYVRGKNLCDFERRFESMYPGKKRLYKRNQLETLEESRTLTAPEFEKFLNDINENKIYADDYDVREMYKNLSGKSPMMTTSMNSTIG